MTTSIQPPPPRPDATPGGDDELHLREVWDLLLRNRLLIAGCIAAVVALALVYTVTRTPVYEARASIRIDEDQSNVPVLDILQSISSGSQVETEMEVLRSRSLAEDVVDRLGIQLQLRSPAERSRAEFLEGVRVEPWAPAGMVRLERQEDGSFLAESEGATLDGTRVEIGEPVALSGATFTLKESVAELRSLELEFVPFDEAVESVMQSMSVTRPNRDANVVRLRYESPDTALVRMVPDLLANRFIARRADVLKTGARSTVEFLGGQIDSLAVELALAEDALQAYREGEQVVSLEAEKEAQVTQLARIQAERNQLDAERAALQRLLTGIEGEVAAAGPEAVPPSPYRRIIAFPSLLPIPAVSELLRSLNESEGPLSELLGRRTREDPDVESLVRRIREIEQQLRGIAETYLEGLTNQVEELDRTLARFSRDLEQIPARELQTARLMRQAVVLEDIYTLLQTRLKESEIAQAVEDATVRVVDPALRTREPVRPRLLLNLLLAGVLGTMLGVGVAFGREFMDDTVHTREDIEKATGGLSVIGMIPRIQFHGALANGNGNGRRNGRVTRIPADGLGHLEERLVTGRDPRNPVSEAYRSLRTNLTFVTPDHPLKTLVMTSAMPQEGKSTTSANLAVTLCQMGLKVLLLDTDLRRGVLHALFKVPREPGLSNILAGQATLAESIRRVDLGENGILNLIPTGVLPPNPSELLSSHRMTKLIAELGEAYDTVILDCPPLNVVTDAAIVGARVDGVIVVARASTTEKGALAFATDLLRRVRAPVVGTVLNDLDHKRDSRYSKGYGRYGYYHEEYYGESD